MTASTCYPAPPAPPYPAPAVTPHPSNQALLNHLLRHRRCFFCCHTNHCRPTTPKGCCVARARTQLYASCSQNFAGPQPENLYGFYSSSFPSQNSLGGREATLRQVYSCFHLLQRLASSHYTHKFCTDKYRNTGPAVGSYTFQTECTLRHF